MREHTCIITIHPLLAHQTIICVMLMSIVFLFYICCISVFFLRALVLGIISMCELLPVLYCMVKCSK